MWFHVKIIADKYQYLLFNLCNRPKSFKILTPIIMNDKTNFQLKTIKFLLSNLFFFALIFCLSTSVSTVSAQQLTFNPNKSGNGLIFGSLTFPKEKARFNGYFLQINFKSTDPKIARKNFKEVKFFPAQIIKMRHKGDLDNGLTYLFAIERPEGDYEITGIRLFSNSGFAVLQRNDNIGGLSIPFTVKKGEILYVGNIQFNEYAADNETVFNYQNNFEKDLTGIKIAEPYIYWDAAKNDDSIKISNPE